MSETSTPGLRKIHYIMVKHKVVKLSKFEDNESRYTGNPLVFYRMKTNLVKHTSTAAVLLSDFYLPNSLRESAV